MRSVIPLQRLLMCVLVCAWCCFSCQNGVTNGVNSGIPENTGETPLPPENTGGETGEVPIPAEVNTLTFDYASLARYRQAPYAFSVGAMPGDLRAKLDACLYTGPVDWTGGGWFQDAAMAAVTNAAAQAFFTAIAQHVNTTGGTDDFLKIKMMHDWVVDYLIADEAVAYGDYSTNCARGSQSPTDILRRGVDFRNSANGMAVCWGHALLFKELVARLAALDNGIDGSWEIRGWYCSAGEYPPARPTSPSTDGVPTNHSWNIVRINGLKFIVDCTSDNPLYGSSSWTGFLPDPRESIKRRISKWKGDQLLDADGVAPWDDTVRTWEQYVESFGWHPPSSY